MAFTVKEIFYTLQGEGLQAGRPAIFCRFSGCNLWSGREQDRATAQCRFCDTDFVGTNGSMGGKYPTVEKLSDRIATAWPTTDTRHRFVVLTGGEPLLQVNDALIDALHARSFEVAVETNGSLPVPESIDWICVSPKAGVPVVQRKGNELKLVFPQAELPPDMVADWAFQHFLLQPMDGPQRKDNTGAAIAYCAAHPQWRLSLQTHKIIGIR